MERTVKEMIERVQDAAEELQAALREISVEADPEDMERIEHLFSAKRLQSQLSEYIQVEA